MSYGVMEAFSFEPVTDAAVVALCTEIVRRRDCGEVLFSLSSVTCPKELSAGQQAELVDLYVAQEGCVGLREEWTRLSRNEAHLLLVRILARDLAYNASIMSAHDAQRLAQRFLGLFPPDCRLFSNTVVTDKDEDLSTTRSGWWNPITKATFDTGVIALGGGRIGMVWVKDED
jgi:hypothetical protein